MTKLFLIILALANTSLSIAARKDSSNQQEKAEFALYLQDIQNITEITPHAMAHFFDTTTSQPLYPPSKKPKGSLEYTFDMDKYKGNYTVFGNDFEWNDVKDLIKQNADDIVKKKSPYSNIYTVTFDTGHVPTKKITSIQCVNNNCKNKLDKINDLQMFFNKNPTNLKRKKKRKVKIINKKFKEELQYTTTTLNNIKQITIIVDGRSPTQLKTCYPKS